MEASTGVLGGGQVGGGWAAVQGRVPEGRGQELGCPGAGRLGAGRAPVFVAPCQLHCNKSGVAAAWVCTTGSSRPGCRRHGTGGQQHPSLAAGGGVPGAPRREVRKNLLGRTPGGDLADTGLGWADSRLEECMALGQ